MFLSRYLHVYRQLLCGVQDCSVTAQCIAALGTTCPELLELRFRGASPTYSLERISRRAELLRVSDMLSVVKGELTCKDASADHQAGCTPTGHLQRAARQQKAAAAPWYMALPANFCRLPRRHEDPLRLAPTASADEILHRL